MEIALMVVEIVGQDFGVQIEVVPTDDNRSYRICSEKLKREFGWQRKKTIMNAIEDLVAAFKAYKVSDPDDDIYYNIKVLKKLGLG